MLQPYIPSFTSLVETELLMSLKQGVTLTSSAAASTGTSAAPSSKKNDAGSSTTISIIGGAAALGLAVLAL